MIRDVSLPDVFSDFSLTKVLGLKRSRRNSDEDTLSNFLSDLIKSGNASITIKISALKSKNARDENGLFTQEVPEYPASVADLLSILTPLQEEPLPPVPPLGGGIVNRSPMAEDILGKLVLQDYLNQLGAMSPSEMLPPTVNAVPPPLATPPTPATPQVSPEDIKNLLGGLRGLGLGIGA